jgi:hypothetical protein
MLNSLRMIGAFLIVVTVSLVFVRMATAHYEPGRHNAVHAIQLVWCGKSNVSCPESREAVTVAKCEASALWWWHRNQPTQAVNGQYKGMFQMGESERERFGHGPDPWSQARAAKRYWNVSGWHPWQCLPYGGLRW